MNFPDLSVFADFWSPAAMQSNLILLVHLLGAMLLGMLVGYERSYHGHAVGMRTFALVCMASAGVVTAFIYPNGWFGNQHLSLLTADAPSRAVQGVMTGIGFLGAGVIMREGRSISGLSTAASVWVAAAIGLLVGMGLYPAAIALALLCAFSMSVVLRLERWLPREKRYFFELSFTADAQVDKEVILALATRFGFRIRRDTVTLSLTHKHQNCAFAATSKPRQDIDITGLAAALQQVAGLAAFTIAPTRN